MAFMRLAFNPQTCTMSILSQNLRFVRGLWEKQKSSRTIDSNEEYLAHPAFYG